MIFVRLGCFPADRESRFELGSPVWLIGIAPCALSPRR